MIDSLEHDKCTGCFSCVQKCPKGAIEIVQDEDGFRIPRILSDKCVECNLCATACPQVTPVMLNMPRAAYAVRLKDDEMLAKSCSGGVFAALARSVLQKGGIVFGAAMDASGTVRTIGISETAQLPLLQGSKYVQCDTGNSFIQIRRELQTGREVLYASTPCQIAGLYAFLGEKFDNLLTMDIICHGVPSQELFTRYLSWLGDKTHREVKSYQFRCKEKEGWALIDCIAFSRGKNKYVREYLNPYTRAFLNGDTYRESCYRCRYACNQRVGDITAGDYWGIKNVHPEFFSPKGVSLLIVNTERGEKIFHEVAEWIESIPSKVEYMEKYNGNLVKPSDRPIKRSEIYKKLYTMSMDEFVQSELKVPFDLKEQLKKWVPYKVRRKILATLRGAKKHR